MMLAASRTVVLVLAAWALAAGGCAYLVTPPTPPGDPVSVFIADHGYHSSLLLPRGQTGTAEYAYGHYEWFALNKDEAWRAPGTVLIPGRGTLGRREVGTPCTTARLRAAVWAEELLEIRVERARAEALVRALDARFESAGGAGGASGVVINPVLDMAFVPDERRYWLGYTCNTALAEWLRDLGCTVRGGSLEAEFRIVGRR